MRPVRLPSRPASPTPVVTGRPPPLVPSAVPPPLAVGTVLPVRTGPPLVLLEPPSGLPTVPRSLSGRNLNLHLTHPLKTKDGSCRSLLFFLLVEKPSTTGQSRCKEKTSTHNYIQEFRTNRPQPINQQKKSLWIFKGFKLGTHLRGKDTRLFRTTHVSNCQTYSSRFYVSHL